MPKTAPCRFCGKPWHPPTKCAFRYGTVPGENFRHNNPNPKEATPAQVHQRLQRALERHRPLLVVDWLLAKCPDPECAECAQLICPHHDPLHFKNQHGCPSCMQAM